MGHKNSKEGKTKISGDQFDKCNFIDLLDKNEKKEETNDEHLLKSSSNLTLTIDDIDGQSLDSFSLNQEQLYQLNSDDSDEFNFDQDQLENVKPKHNSKLKIYKPNRINLLYNQNIDEIRKNKNLFTDNVFKTTIKSLIKDTKSDFAKSLFETFKCYHNNLNLIELNKQIKWKRSQVNII